MFGIAVLATLVLGGAIIALDDDDDNSVDESNATEDPELRVETDTATDGGDLLAFGDEDDVIDALGGNDEVLAGAGDDDVQGGAGDDTIFGQGGNDDLHGGTGEDNIFGSGGQDTLSGDDGDDGLIASAGDDTVFGGAGSDFAVGGSGADSILGGAGNDILYGGEYDNEPDVEDLNTLRTDPLNFDLIEVNDEAADTLNGGDGDDALFLDSGDVGRGGSGSDLFALLANEEVGDAIAITDYSDEEDAITIGIRGEDSEFDEDDFSVVNDTDTGDALIMQGTDVLARVEDAGETLTIEDITFLLVAADPAAA